MNKIHPSAIVDQKAQLGNNVEIGPFCIVGPQVTIGDDCNLRSHVVIEGNTTIGKENIFYQFGTIGSAPQDHKYKGGDTLLTIGDHNIFREGTSIHRGTETGRGKTTIGNHNFLMGYVHVGHDCQMGNYNILANNSLLAGHVTIDDHVTLNGRNGVIQFIRVGSYAFFGAATTVDKHIAPYSMGYGERIQIKSVNIVGLKRNGFSREAVGNIIDVHQIYFRSELNEKDALRNIEEQYGQFEEIKLFIDFVRTVEGGVRK